MKHTYKKTAGAVLIALLLACVLLLCGCSFEPPSAIRYATVNENGELIITYTNGEQESLGVVVGKDGKDGAAGADGVNGKDGKDGKDGEAGALVIEGQQSAAVAANRGLRSAVCVVAGIEHHEDETVSYQSAGAGVIYEINKEQGSAFVITNHHVVYDESNTQTNGIADISLYLHGSLYLSEEHAIRATYVGGSAYYDIAVLYVENSDLLRQSDAIAVTVADSDRIVAGQTAIAVGNPEGDGSAVSSGIVSVDSERIRLSGALDTVRVIRVDTPVNHGNSGGGLYNDRGELIGIVNAKIVSSDVESIGYAIPSSVVCAVADNIIDYCFGTEETAVMRPLLGITITIGNSYGVYDAEAACMRIVEEITVHEISESSMMYGTLEVGDVFVRMTVAGKTKAITRQFHLLDFMLTARIGDELTYTVLRDGQELTFRVTVTEDMISKT